MVFFFNIWEIRILCSHCPYYAEEEIVDAYLQRNPVMRKAWEAKGWHRGKAD